LLENISSLSSLGCALLDGGQELIVIHLTASLVLGEDEIDVSGCALFVQNLAILSKLGKGLTIDIWLASREG